MAKSTKQVEEILENGLSNLTADDAPIVTETFIPVQNETLDLKKTNTQEETELKTLLNQPEKPLRERNASISEASESIQKSNEIPSGFIFPEKVIIKPRSKKNRLGLERTKENFMRIPGTKFRFEPDVVGNSYVTGLEKLTSKQIQDLQLELGKTLNDDFYADLTFSFDGSNPEGYNMNLSKAYNKVVYLAMCVSKTIAETESEILNGTKPFAEFYIYNLEREAEILEEQQTLMRRMNNVYDDCNDYKKRQIGKIMNINVWTLSDRVVRTLLWKKLTDEPNARLRKKTQETFLKIAAWNDETLNTYCEVLDGIKYNFIRKTASNDYSYDGEVIGSTLESVITKLREDPNLRSSLKLKLETKR